MNKDTQHPDLYKKTIPNFTLRPWNIRVFRLLFKFFHPKPICPTRIKRTVQIIEGVTLRIHRPIHNTTTGALLWLHGGGLIIGSPKQDDATCATLAETLDITVIAVQYRLAPQHPFPTPLDDCLKAWNISIRHAHELGIDPKKIALAGVSAGGGLAACLALRIRDEVRDKEGIQPIAQLLIYPMLDDRTTTRKDINPKEHLVWNNQSNTTGWEAYLGDKRGAPTLPPYAAASRHTDLSNLPPTWIGIGTQDLFYDENVDFAQRLQECNVPTTIETIEGAYHGFNDIEPQALISRRFFDMQVQFLNKFLRNKS